MRKLRLPTAEELEKAKVNSPLMERAVIEAKWAELYPAPGKMHNSQVMMLIVLMTYLQSEMFKHARENGYVPEPLIFSLGLASGATTFIRVLKAAYPDLVRVVASSRDVKALYGFDHVSGPKDKPNFKNKIVIFDGNLVWHDRRFIDHVRGSMPFCYISFGS